MDLRNEIHFETISAFIFDMDGTIVDTTRIDYNGWVDVFRLYDKAFMPFNEYYKILGVKSSEILSSYLGLSGKALEEGMQQRMNIVNSKIKEEGVQLVPGVTTLLEILKSKGLSMALATGARREKMELILDQLDLLPYFDFFVTGDDVTKGKPDPMIFIEAGRLLGAPPSSTIVIEDAKNGVTAAKSAGMKCIALSTTTPADELTHADVIINEYSELLVNDYFRKRNR